MNLVSCFALFLAPSIFFALKNIGIENNFDLQTQIIVSIFFFSFTLLALSPVIFLKNGFFSSLLTFFALIWYFQFQIEFEYSIGLKAASLILIYVAFASICIVALLLFLKIKLSRFVLIFLALNLLIVSLPNANYLYSFVINKTLISHKKIITNDLSRSDKNKNVYYVIADGLTSLSLLEKNFQIPTAEIKSTLEQSGFIIANKAYSSYNITHLTLASIINMDYPINEQSPRYKDRSAFFPGMLYYSIQAPLILYLNKIGYRFIHIGNSWAPCNKNFSECLRSTETSSIRFYLSRLLNNYGIQSLWGGTPLWEFLSRIITKIKYDDNFDGADLLLDKNDAIATSISGILSGDIKPNSSSFYFIHHLNPHPPALNSDCSEKYETNYKIWARSTYIESSKCAFKRILELTELLNKTDPDAIVVFQGDHGPAITYDFNKDISDLSSAEIEERFSIFNAIKFPSECNSININQAGNVETIRYIMRCISNDTDNLTINTPISYAGYYEKHKNFGKVEKIFFKHSNSN